MSWVTQAKNLAECANLRGYLATRWFAVDDSIRTAAARFKVDPDLLAAVAFVESKWNPSAKSPVGAAGLFQTMPSTGKNLAAQLGIAYAPFAAGYSALYGGLYLSKLLKRYDNPEHAIAAYNAGPGAVDKYGGIPPFAETQRFVPAVTTAYKAIKLARLRCATGYGIVPWWGRKSYSYSGSGSSSEPRPRPSPRPQPSPEPSPAASGGGAGLLVLLAIVGVGFFASGGDR